jgi:hypothetical protein
MHRTGSHCWRALVSVAEKTLHKGRPVADVQYQGREERFQVTAVGHDGASLNGIVETRAKRTTVKWEPSE